MKIHLYIVFVFFQVKLLCPPPEKKSQAKRKIKDRTRRQPLI